MQMEPNKDNEGVDFSNFFKKNENSARETGGGDENNNSQIKKYLAIAFFIVALAVSGYLIFKVAPSASKPAANYEPPKGYLMIYPSKEPPRLEKVK